MKPIESKLRLLRILANRLVYLSVILGVALLAQLYALVPPWLFFLALAGWLVYLVIAIMLAAGREIAYPIALVLSILTLTVSLPQPEHQSLVGAGVTLASLTFIVGSAVQVAVLVTVTSFLLLKRRESEKGKLV